MATNATTHSDAEPIIEQGVSTAQKMDRTLDQWRERIDELKVQMDLATLDIREDCWRHRCLHMQWQRSLTTVRQRPLVMAVHADEA